MVLAAGLGQRLSPLTERWAKPALPFLGRSLIEYIMVALQRADVREVVVNLHHRPESIIRALDDVSRSGFRIRYSHESEILGTGGGLKQAEPLLGEQTFILFNGDTLVDIDLADLIDHHREREAQATLLLRPRPAGKDYTPIGLGERGRLVSFGNETSDSFMFAGVWILEPTLLRRLTPGRFSRLEVELLPFLVEERTAFGYVSDGAWFDIGTPRRYMNACLGMLRAGIFREFWRAEVVRQPESPGALVAVGPETVIDSGVRFEGDSVLGAACRVGCDATLERAVLGDRVLVGEGANVRRSIVTAGVRLAAGSQIEDKVVMSAEMEGKDSRAEAAGEAHVVTSIEY